MKLTLNTKKLQDLTSRAIKGCSNNKMIRITSLMLIKAKERELSLQTTDGTNHLYVYQDGVEDGEFYVVVDADMFHKLVSKMTCESVTLELKDSNLEVKGNGTYKIKLLLDEETGTPLTFPDPAAEAMELEFDVTVDLNVKKLKDMVAVNKQSLSEKIDVPCYNNYYSADSSITTDTYKICEYSLHIFEKPRLISPEIMNLIEVLNGDEVRAQVYDKDGIIMFSTDDVIIYGRVSEGIDNYAIDPIKGLLHKEFGSMCKVSKSALLSLLDRLSLFVESFDKNTISMMFTKEGLCISSKQSTSTEIIPYTEAKDVVDYSCVVDITMLQAQVKVQSSDTVTIYYGENNAIKLVDGDAVTQVIALITD